MRRAQIIGRAGVGVDNIDRDAATKHGVIVMNTPGGNTRAAAELTMSLLANLLRQVPAAHASMRAVKWERKAFMGTEMGGKTLGLFGLGSIGGAVARYATAFGMRVIGFGERRRPAVPRRVPARALSRSRGRAPPPCGPRAPGPVLRPRFDPQTPA